MLCEFYKTIKNHSNMFWIVCDPSSGSIELCLTEITLILNLQCVCVHSTTGWELLFPARRTMHTYHRFKIMLPNTDQAHKKYL